MTTSNSAKTEAQPSTNQDILSAKFVSEWDGGVQILTDALVDLRTGAVQIEVSDDDHVVSLEILDREFVQLACGSEFETHEINDTYYICDLAALRAAVGYTAPTVH
uniref:Uncharacterized protein n=1 Tax=Pseudomonas fluorescens (strain SBW25) TaxID=216595 RepID=A0A0G4E5C0_PSEFS|nr:hypothetical protein [Pseudomonas fluorescens]CEK42213.1 hypothetical protein PQBR57_0260 [Pseudomonas fluorescens SBW25]